MLSPRTARVPAAVSAEADGRLEVGFAGHAPGVAPRGCYDSGAVLGGELAVPCTCNPLQQG